MQISVTGTSNQLGISSQNIETTITSQQSPPLKQVIPAKDHLNISEEAKESSHKGHATHGLHGRNDNFVSRELISFLSDLLQALSGNEVGDLQVIPDASETEDNPLQSSQSLAPVPIQISSGEMQQTSLSMESKSLSFSGMVKSKDGNELAFSLELHVTNASFSNQFFSFQTGTDGSSFNFAGTAAELTSTSFSFSLASSDPTTEGARGKGKFHLNDELSAIGKAIKPVLKEALGEQAWSKANQLLRTIA